MSFLQSDISDKRIAKAFLCFKDFIPTSYYLHPERMNYCDGGTITGFVGSSHFDLDNVLSGKHIQITQIGFGYEKKREGLRFYFTDEVSIPVNSQFYLRGALNFLEKIESFGKEYSKEKS